MAIGKKGGLLASTLLDAGDGDDDDPRTGLVNLADVMLVFACGLMIALVGHYGVDLTNTQATGANMEGAQKVDGQLQAMSAGDVDNAGDSEVSKVGTLYQDPTTGEYYVVKKQ